MKQITSPSSMHETGHSMPLHWDNPEELDAEGGGRCSQDGEKRTPVPDSCQYMAKSTTIL